MALVNAFLAVPVGSLRFALIGGGAALGLRLKQYYERLQGEELEVLEAIAKLAGQSSCINYDKLGQKDYDGAFGTVNPMLDAIAGDVGVDTKSALRTLNSLKRQGIVAERHGRWGITF
jgi:hypothetical protein